LRPEHSINDRSRPPTGEEFLRLRQERDAAFRSAQAAFRDTTRLTRLFSILSEPAPLELMLDRVLSTLSELFEADICVLLDLAGTGSFSPLAAVGLPEDMIHLSMSDAESGYVAAAMARGSPILKTEIGEDRTVDPQFQTLGVETAVWVPVIGSQVARGVLILGRCRPHPFAQADADLLTAMAYRIGLALEQAQRSVQLEQIVRSGREIACHLDESAVCSEAVDRLPAIVGADAAALVLSGPGGTLRHVAQIGLDPLDASTWDRLAERLFATRGIAGGLPYSTADLCAVDEAISLPPPSRFPVRALMAVPIRREQQTIGLLCAMRFSTASFSPDGIQVAMLFAAQASAALENARLYRTVQDELAERLRAEQQLHESEERLKLALRGADLGMWDWNIVTGEISFNERWAEMLGYGLDEIEPHVRTREKMIHPDDRQGVGETFQSHSEGQTPYYQAQYRGLTKSGRWIWVLDKGKVTHRDARGVPLRFVGTSLNITEAKQIEAERLFLEQQKQKSHDELEKRVKERTRELASANQLLTYEIKERKRAEEEALRSKEIAEAANRAKSEFLANMSHELRTPLNHIIGFTELVAGRNFGDINETQEEYLNDALNSSHHLLSLINQILDLSKIEAGRLELEPSAVPVKGLLEKSLTLVKGKALKNRIRISLDIDQDAPEFLTGDERKLKQVLVNLLANSVKFTPNGGQIEIRCAVGKDEGGGEAVDGERLVVWVKDSGIGIQSTDLERIFKPFEQVESGATRKYEGAGLGLSLARKLIELHGGRLWAESAGRGKGATFCFTVPIK
jgi:PAS domain S-box-containing protein